MIRKRRSKKFAYFQLTLLNAGRKYLGLNSLSGKVFLTSGLGGMSGAQAKVSLRENFTTFGLAENVSRAIPKKF